MDSLRNSPKYPSNPDNVSVIPDFDAPQGVGDNYGQRVRGYIKAPETGDYVFWISSDDQSELWLSTDEQPQNLQLIAQVFAWTGAGEYTAEPNQQSAPIRLEQGKYYYIQALMVEGGGADHLSARWKLPNGTIEEPIPNSRLNVEISAPQISRQPSSARVIEGQTAEFSLELATFGSGMVQWYRNGQPLTGANSLTYTLNNVKLNDSGSVFYAIATNDFGSVKSASAILTVDRDIEQPTIVSVQTGGENDLVSVTFSEPVSGASATNLLNYKISGGINITGASLTPNGRSVILKTSPLAFGGSYTLTVNNVQDLADIGNVIEPDSTAQFGYGYTPLSPNLVYGSLEKIGPSTRRTGLIISEIMYNPAPRTDGRNIEFVEIYNTEPVLADIGGYKLAGSVEYVFPPGSFIPGSSYLVVARAPSDVQVLYGIPRVFGPYANTLPGSGTIQLLNDQGAELLNVDYDSKYPWPSAPDGSGHSLSLVRPSYGESDPRAWDASQFINGTPGKAEFVAANPHQGLVINEFLANSDAPALDFVELYNYTARPMDVSGVYITDDTGTNKFQIAANTVIPPLGFLSFTETQLGFGLSSLGERIIVRNPQKTRVIDSFKFGAQRPGIPMGRFPDGNPLIQPLASPTPGSANSKVLVSDVVINEIMYHPISENEDEEYLELHNRSSQPVNLRGWRLQEGISFSFISDQVIPAGGYLVVAKNVALLRENYPGTVTEANSVGNYNGNLSNSGERIVLERPDITILTNGSRLETNISYVAVCDVTYQTGGRWPKWADGGGGSLELVSPDADPNSPASWADSDESNKGQWVTFERRGILDYGSTNFAPTNPSRNLHVIMLGEGEALLDNVQVIPDGGTNVVRNGGLEQGMNDWLAGGTHSQTSIETGGGQPGNALHIRAVDRGDTAANRIRVKLSSGLTNGEIATIKADLKWVRGTPEFLLRIHGNYLELAGTNFVPKNLGTPGLRNSRSVANIGPSITQTTHRPVLPIANQQVTVSAQVIDPDRVALVELHYRIDPATNYTRVVMDYNGAGFYSGVIPGQTNGAMAAFYIQSLDTRGAISRFPAGAPEAEALVRFGDSSMPGLFGNYRFWLSQKNVKRWEQREASNNSEVDTTFVYNNDRVVYNMGTLFSGSPFHWSGYNSPLGSSANYEMIFPDDDLFLGQTDFVLNMPSNLASDRVGVREQVFFWMADQVGQPFNYRRFHHLYINGQNRGSIGNRQTVFEDAQQPNRDFIQQWFPNDPDGELYKIEDWFEFSDSFQRFNLDADLRSIVTTNLQTGLREYKQERYRGWFRKRAVRNSAHDYTELYRLVSAMNNTNETEYVNQVSALIDVDEWLGAIALRHIAGDWDAFGYGRGKNMYAYKPQNGKWQLLHWDVAFAFGLGDGPQTDLFSTIESTTGRMFRTPVFLRAYLRALYEAAHGPMMPSRVHPVIDAKFNALTSNGFTTDAPGEVQDIKNFIENRRQYVLTVVETANSGFAITSNNGNNYSTNRNTFVLTGVAPVNVKTIRVNGVDVPVTWTSVNGWETRLALKPGQNVLNVQGIDSAGNVIPSGTDTITVNISNSGDSINGRVVFNEIQYDAGETGGQFVELFNRSSTTAFDLSGMRVNGIDFSFPAGSVIAPGGFLVLAKNELTFGEHYGFATRVAGEFLGNLDNNGETLTLLRPDETGTNEIAVAAVRYENLQPWSPNAIATGGSLQLIDPAQDSTRVGNWTAQTGVATPGRTNSTRATLAAFPLVWVNEIQPDATAPWVELYNSGTTAVSLQGFYLTDDTNLTKWPFPAGTSIAAGGRLVVTLDGQPGSPGNLHANFKPGVAAGMVALSGSLAGRTVVFDYLRYGQLAQGQSYGAYPEGQAVRRQVFYVTTPGAPNDITSPPYRVFINEWMASNSRTVQDPDDNDFDDWFELYNADSRPADLGGYTLTSDLADPTKFTIPAGTIIPAGGFLLVWADEERATNGQLHVDFKLSANGEAIGLFAPDGTQIDAVTFGPQTRDVSMGRTQDGGSQIEKLAQATPGYSNSGSNPGGFILKNVTVTGSTLNISWDAENGTTYEVQYKDNITDSWSHLTDVTASAASASFSDTVNKAHRFYQVRKP